MLRGGRCSEPARDGQLPCTQVDAAVQHTSYIKLAKKDSVLQIRFSSRVAPDRRRGPRVDQHPPGLAAGGRSGLGLQEQAEPSAFRRPWPERRARRAQALAHAPSGGKDPGSGRPSSGSCQGRSGKGARALHHGRSGRGAARRGEGRSRRGLGNGRRRRLGHRLHARPGDDALGEGAQLREAQVPEGRGPPSTSSSCRPSATACGGLSAPATSCRRPYRGPSPTRSRRRRTPPGRPRGRRRPSLTISKRSGARSARSSRSTWRSGPEGRRGRLGFVQVRTDLVGLQSGAEEQQSVLEARLAEGAAAAGTAEGGPVARRAGDAGNEGGRPAARHRAGRGGAPAALDVQGQGAPVAAPQGAGPGAASRRSGPGARRLRRDARGPRRSARGSLHGHERAALVGRLDSYERDATAVAARRCVQGLE